MATEASVYVGERGDNFKNILRSIYDKGDIKERYVRELMSDESMEIFDQVFTHKSAYPSRPDYNYEIYEQLGDLSGNKFIVTYMYKRFPQLRCALGVKVVARLRINYGAKQTFFKIAQNLNFWPFISASVYVRSREMKDRMEDVLEAFLGAVESILDNRFTVGVGYAVIYNILKNIFDNMDISLKYEDLIDPKTRLKELFDSRPDLGKIEYRTTKVELINRTECWSTKLGLLGNGSASLKADSEQSASRAALRYLQSIGIFKPPPPEYMMFEENV